MATLPLSAFRVPDGKLAITFDLHNLPCRTAVLAVEDIECLVSCTEEALELQPADRDSVPRHVHLRKLLRAVWVLPDVGEQCSVGLGLWLALNNPLGADEIRSCVSRDLRQNGRAQMMIACDERETWAFGISDRPSELAALIAAVPDGLALVVHAGQVGSEEPIN